MKLYFYLLILLGSITCSCVPDKKEAKPNVIIILTDDQGYGEVGAHGNKFIRTPNMDDLYHEGVRLTDFHVNNVCSPSRASLITGKYAASVGVWHTLGGRNILHAGELTIADIFKENGYATCMVGKWHLGDNYPYRPEDRGFDEVFRIGGGSLGQVADYWENGLWDGHYWNGREWEPTEGYCTDVQFDAALNFIDRSKDTPFLLYLATTAPHSPIGVADEYVDPYLEMGFSEEVSKFYGMVSNIDDNIGRLRDHLRKAELEENTILIFMSDNGSACAKKDTTIYNAGMRGKKGSDYDGGHRVPCFIYWPGGQLVGGRSVTQLTAHIDILPTLVDACELSISGEYSFHGLNILPILKDERGDWPERYIVTEGKVNDRAKLFKSSCVMDNTWRLVSGSELFNIREDPGQKYPASDDKTKHALQEAYKIWHSGVKESFRDEYTFIFSDSFSRVPFVTMDLLPDNTLPKPKSVWNQSAVKKGMRDLGEWNIEFPESGTYVFHLCRLPAEADQESYIDRKTSDLQLRGALVKIDGEIVVSTSLHGESEAILYCDITAGIHRVAANFTDDSGAEMSAYYVYISR